MMDLADHNLRPEYGRALRPDEDVFWLGMPAVVVRLHSRAPGKMTNGFDRYVIRLSTTRRNHFVPLGQLRVADAVVGGLLAQ